MKLLAPEFEHRDHRRTLSQILTATIQQVNVYHAKKGANLGNHFHKETTEYFHITKGTMMVNDEIVNRGHTFYFSPNEKHSLTCLTDTIFLTFLTKPFNQEKPDLWTS